MLHDLTESRVGRVIAPTTTAGGEADEQPTDVVDHHSGCHTEAIGREALLGGIEASYEVAAHDQSDAEPEAEGEDPSHVSPLDGRWSSSVVVGARRLPQGAQLRHPVHEGGLVAEGARLVQHPALETDRKVGLIARHAARMVVRIVVGP